MRTSGSWRDDVVGILTDVAVKANALIVVGNGDLCRRVWWARGEAVVLPLEGAMGAAAAVAFGFIRASGASAIVLEGDGNRLMGAPAAEWLQSCQDVLHAVVVNKSYYSSGGQPMPVELESRAGDETVAHGDYRRLQALCHEWLRTRAGRRLLIEEKLNPNHTVSRPDVPLAEICQALALWLGTR